MKTWNVKYILEGTEKTCCMVADSEEEVIDMFGRFEYLEGAIVVFIAPAEELELERIEMLKSIYEAVNEPRFTYSKN